MAVLTPAQEDYVEVIFRLEQSGHDPVRVTDIADELGTRLPTVSRTVQKLAELGLVLHDRRRSVRLSARGKRMAQDLVHRHNDLVAFFRIVLGLDHREAEQNACRLEHGLSGRAAQRLHEFLEYVKELPNADRVVLQRFLSDVSSGKKDFTHLPAGRTNGWRS